MQEELVNDSLQEELTKEIAPCMVLSHTRAQRDGDTYLH